MVRKDRSSDVNKTYLLKMLPAIPNTPEKSIQSRRIHLSQGHRARYAIALTNLQNSYGNLYHLSIVNVRFVTLIFGKHLAEEEVEVPSTDTSGYCQARARLPEKLLEKLFNSSAQSLEEKVTTEYLWCGRNVKVIDGSTVSMPDTIENQKEYPQPSSQKPGCGFPIAKIGVIFSLVTGAAVALCIDVLNTHDIKLARKLYSFLEPNDVLLGDTRISHKRAIAITKIFILHRV
jgi:hypothetical protein